MDDLLYTISPCDLELWQMTLKNNRSPLLCCFNLCASFHSLRWIKIGVTVQKRSFGSKSAIFLSRVTLKFDRRPWKNNRTHLLCCFNLCASFHSLRWIKIGVTVQKRSFGSKSAIFLSRVTLKFERRPWKNNRTHPLCCFNLCASFHSHQWIQTGVTVRKRLIRVKVGDFMSRVTFKFDGWSWKTIVYLFYAASSFVHYFIAISQFKLELQSGNAQFGSKLTIFVDAWHWNLTDDLEKQ